MNKPTDTAMTPGVMLVPNGKTCVVVGWGQAGRPFSTVVPIAMRALLIHNMKG